MVEIFRSIGEIQVILIQNGINIISIFAVLGITHLLKTNLIIYSGAKKSLYTIITALVLSVVLSLLFCYLHNMFVLKTVLLNIFLNVFVSSYSQNIIEAIKKITNKKIG